MISDVHSKMALGRPALCSLCVFVILFIPHALSHNVNKRQTVNNNNGQFQGVRPIVLQDPPVFDIYQPMKDPEAVRDLENSAQGKKSYPSLTAVVKTNFTCRGMKGPGWYSDIETGCQQYHRCYSQERSTAFICPPGTLFSQETLICDFWYNVKCSEAQGLYEYANSRLYKLGVPLHGDANWTALEIKRQQAQVATVAPAPVPVRPNPITRIAVQTTRRTVPTTTRRTTTITTTTSTTESTTEETSTVASTLIVGRYYLFNITFIGIDNQAAISLLESFLSTSITAPVLSNHAGYGRFIIILIPADANIQQRLSSLNGTLIPEDVPASPGDFYAPLFPAIQLVAVNYTIITEIVETSFSCVNRLPNFYPDMETNCQLFHYCGADNQTTAQLCPAGSLFDYPLQTCVIWYEVRCQHVSPMVILPPPTIAAIVTATTHKSRIRKSSTSTTTAATTVESTSESPEEETTTPVGSIPNVTGKISLIFPSGGDATTPSVTSTTTSTPATATTRATTRRTPSVIFTRGLPTATTRTTTPSRTTARKVTWWVPPAVSIATTRRTTTTAPPELTTEEPETSTLPVAIPPSAGQEETLITGRYYLFNITAIGLDNTAAITLLNGFLFKNNTAPALQNSAYGRFIVILMSAEENVQQNLFPLDGQLVPENIPASTGDYYAPLNLNPQQQKASLVAVPYPVLTETVQTRFNCASRPTNRYYPDIDTKCQQYHYCDASGDALTQLCPANSLFSAELQTCDAWYDVTCGGVRVITLIILPGFPVAVPPARTTATVTTRSTTLATTRRSTTLAITTRATTASTPARTETVSGAVGSSVVIPCPAYDQLVTPARTAPTLSMVEWYKGQQVPEHLVFQYMSMGDSQTGSAQNDWNHRDVTFIMQGSPRVALQNVVASDAGIYYCVILVGNRAQPVVSQLRLDIPGPTSPQPGGVTVVIQLGTEATSTSSATEPSTSELVETAEPSAIQVSVGSLSTEATTVSATEVPETSPANRIEVIINLEATETTPSTTASRSRSRIRRSSTTSTAAPTTEASTTEAPEETTETTTVSTTTTTTQRTRVINNIPIKVVYNGGVGGTNATTTTTRRPTIATRAATAPPSRVTTASGPAKRTWWQPPAIGGTTSRAATSARSTLGGAAGRDVDASRTRQPTTAATTTAPTTRATTTTTTTTATTTTSPASSGVTVGSEDVVRIDVNFPSSTVAPGAVSGVVGTSVMIPCPAYAQLVTPSDRAPTISMVEWYKGQQVPEHLVFQYMSTATMQSGQAQNDWNHRDVTFIMQGGPQVVLQNVVAGDAGLYYCAILVGSRAQPVVGQLRLDIPETSTSALVEETTEATEAPVTPSSGSFTFVVSNSSSSGSIVPQQPPGTGNTTVLVLPGLQIGGGSTVSGSGQNISITSHGTVTSGSGSSVASANATFIYVMTTLPNGTVVPVLMNGPNVTSLVNPENTTTANNQTITVFSGPVTLPAPNNTVPVPIMVTSNQPIATVSANNLPSNVISTALATSTMYSGTGSAVLYILAINPNGSTAGSPGYYLLPSMFNGTVVPIMVHIPEGSAITVAANGSSSTPVITFQPNGASGEIPVFQGALARGNETISNPNGTSGQAGSAAAPVMSVSVFQLGNASAAEMTAAVTESTTEAPSEETTEATEVTEEITTLAPQNGSVVAAVIVGSVSLVTTVPTTPPATTGRTAPRKTATWWQPPSTTTPVRRRASTAVTPAALARGVTVVTSTQASTSTTWHPRPRATTTTRAPLSSTAGIGSVAVISRLPGSSIQVNSSSGASTTVTNGSESAVPNIEVPLSENGTDIVVPPEVSNITVVIQHGDNNVSETNIALGTTRRVAGQATTPATTRRSRVTWWQPPATTSASHTTRTRPTTIATVATTTVATTRRTTTSSEAPITTETPSNGSLTVILLPGTAGTGQLRRLQRPDAQTTTVGPVVTAASSENATGFWAFVPGNETAGAAIEPRRTVVFFPNGSTTSYPVSENVATEAPAVIGVTVFVPEGATAAPLVTTTAGNVSSLDIFNLFGPESTGQNAAVVANASAAGSTKVTAVEVILPSGANAADQAGLNETITAEANATAGAVLPEVTTAASETVATTVSLEAGENGSSLTIMAIPVPAGTNTTVGVVSTGNDTTVAIGSETGSNGTSLEIVALPGTVLPAADNETNSGSQSIEIVSLPGLNAVQVSRNNTASGKRVQVGGDTFLNANSSMLIIGLNGLETTTGATRRRRITGTGTVAPTTRGRVTWYVPTTRTTASRRRITFATAAATEAPSNGSVITIETGASNGPGTVNITVIGGGIAEMPAEVTEVTEPTFVPVTNPRFANASRHRFDVATTTTAAPVVLRVPAGAIVITTGALGQSNASADNATVFGIFGSEKSALVGFGGRSSVVQRTQISLENQSLPLDGNATVVESASVLGVPILLSSQSGNAVISSAAGAQGYFFQSPETYGVLGGATSAPLVIDGEKYVTRKVLQHRLLVRIGPFGKNTAAATTTASSVSQAQSFRQLRRLTG